MFLIQYDSRRRGMQEILLNFSVFKSFFKSDRFFSYKSISLKLFIPSFKEVCATKMLFSSSVSVAPHWWVGSHWLFLALACVRMWDFRLVDCANFLLQPSKGQT